MNHETLVSLISNVALLLALGVVHDAIPLRAGPGRRWREALSGCVIGLISLAVMAIPFRFSPGVFFDTRSILLSITGFFFGGIPTIVATLIAAAFRLSQGGVGALTGVGVIVTSAAIGHEWRRLRSRWRGAPPDAAELYALGVVVHLAMLLWMLSLPIPVALRVLRNIGLPVMLIYPLGSVLLGLLIARQQDRAAAAAALRESEARFRMAFEMASIGKAMTLPDGRLNRVNKAFCDMLGYDAETLARKHFIEVTHPEDVAESRRSVEDLLAGRADSRRMEKRYIRSDGALVWGDVNTFLIRDGAGRPLHFIAHINDITQRKKMEMDILAQGELLRTILNNIPLMVAFMDPDGRHRWVNRTWERTFGWTIDEIVGVDVLPWLYPDPSDLEAVRTFIRKAEGRWSEFRLRTRGGETVDVIWTNAALSDGSNIGIGEDISQRKQAARKHRDLEEQLFQAQKMEAVGRLAGGVAHDFNNLLSVILGYGEMLLDDLASSDPARSPVSQMHQAGLRARNLTRQLLAFSRKQVLAVKVVDLNAAVTGFEKLLRRIIGEDIDLRLSLSSEAPLVRADLSQLEQVLLNLAVNARDAMPEGGELTIETRRVELDARYAAERPGVTPGPHVMIAVSDSGVGMDEKTRERIFEPFFSTKGRDQGTGLGLSTVYGIVKQHGGNIWVYSEPGQGAVFRIYLPPGEGAATGPEAVAEETAPTETGTILLVEDDPSVRSMTLTMLAGRGHRVLESSDPAHAVALAAGCQEPIHLVLTDVVMPGMNGPAVFEKIRQSHPEARALYMSGYAEEVITRRGILMAEVEFIQKPFSAKDLRRKVSAMLAGARQATRT